MMKKIIILSLALFTLSLGGCNTKKQKSAAEEAASMQIDSLKNALSQAKNQSNDLMETVQQIQDGFKDINDAEGLVNAQAFKGEASDKQSILDNLAIIQNKLKLNRELIANLKEQLKTSAHGNEKMKQTMEEMVQNFQAQLEEKDSQLEEMRNKIDQQNSTITEQSRKISTLSSNVNTLSKSNEKKTKRLEAQDQALHTAYYVFGTKKELKEQKILKSGAILKSNDFNKDYFTKVDTRVLKSIPLYSKRAILKTTHPAGSYSLEKDSKGQYVLRITNPDRFWSISKYLVITVK